MKKCTEIIGLPVISIDDGCEMGFVRDIVIDASAREVSALLIEDKKWFMGAKLCPFAAISGIGQSAITIEKSEAIISVLDSAETLALLATEITIIGSKILTKAGQFQGKITDMIIDESGKIVNFYVEDIHSKLVTISAEQVVTFGKKVTITNDAVPVTPVLSTDFTLNESISGANEQQLSDEIALVNEQTPDAAVKNLDYRQKKYLIGKKANRRIETDKGILIVEQDGNITEEVIQKAKLSGKFVELSMSIQ
jgi:uncharacterized protein YrrD